MQYLTFLAVWLLSAVILGAVHGARVGTFLGLVIAIGQVAAIRGRGLLAKRRLQRRSEAGHNSPEPNTYNRNRGRLSSVGRAPDL